MEGRRVEGTQGPAYILAVVVVTVVQSLNPRLPVRLVRLLLLSFPRPIVFHHPRTLGPLSRPANLVLLCSQSPFPAV